MSEDIFYTEDGDILLMDWKCGQSITDDEIIQQWAEAQRLGRSRL